MANGILLLTSVAMFLVHCFLLLLHTRGQTLFYVFGTCTSIANHALTRESAKWLDRGTMAVGFVVDLCLIFRDPNLMVLVLGSALCARPPSAQHAFAHMLITLAHTEMLLYKQP
jgi:hypothetical protein